MSVVAAAGYGLVQHFAKHSGAKGFLSGLFTVVFFLGLVWIAAKGILAAWAWWRGRGNGMADATNDDGGPGQTGGGQVNAGHIEQGPNAQVIGQQINNPPPTGQPQSVVTNAPVGVLFGPGAHSDHSSWNLTFNGEAPKPPNAPPQVPATPEERDEIRAELLRVAPLIGALTEIWYVNPHEAMTRSGGTQEDGYVWRDQHDAEVTQCYVAEVYPSVVAVYQKGRIRGFFDPDVETIYESTMEVQVKNLPALFTRLATRS
jgi:hypothetical protein